ncbi:T-cell activation inhibitor, mitochondrial-like [Asterias rubens]|uniref:T-cell activation inhibitor, mitochondrial-like n=1 Tax=Asterias rubens TaxID=7604 RepID=UPI001454E966|nr:T-cell activation inhibitor, mitochondrial-like [Asterias rubens]
MWTHRLARLASIRWHTTYQPLRLHQKHLTTAQTSEFLRPFIFAVHPDFFGRHPKERAVNEYSLQQLYNHLENIRQQSVQASPKDLTFYLRNSQGQAFRTVTVSLLTRDVYTTVSNILKTCSLSTKDLQGFSPNPAAPFPRPIDWHHSYYTYTGKKNPNVATHQARHRAKDSLRYFLKTTIVEARKNIESSLPVREETDRLHAILQEDLQLEDLRWMSRWDLNTFRACLKSLGKLLREHPDIINNLKGKTLVICNFTGVTREGYIMLSSKDVEHQWLSSLSSLPRQMRILCSLSTAERHLSDALGGVTLTRACSIYVMPAGIYLGLLKKLDNALRRFSQTTEGQRSLQRIGRGALANIEMNVTSDSGRLSAFSDGTLHVTASTQPLDLIDFLLENKHKVKYIKRKHQRCLLEETAAIQSCMEELNLAGLTKEDSVTAEEMMLCCKRLIENPVELGVSLNDTRLCIGHIYTKRWGGELCIPWNWNY